MIKDSQILCFQRNRDLFFPRLRIKDFRSLLSRECYLSSTATGILFPFSALTEVEIIRHLKLTFEAERPPPPHNVQQQLLMAAEESVEYV